MLVVGRKSLFLAPWASPKDFLSVLMTWWLLSPRTNDPKERKAETTFCLLGSSLGSHTLSALQSRICYTGHPCPMQEGATYEHKPQEGSSGAILESDEGKVCSLVTQ